MSTDIILWDWDGTLVDSFPTLHKSFNVTRQEFGLSPWTFEEAKMNIAKSARDVFPEMFGKNAAAAEKLFYAAYADLAPQSVTAKAGRSEFLEETTQAGYQHLLISNKRGDILRQECEALGWNIYFKAIIGAGDAAEDKPSAAPVLMAYANARLAHKPEHFYVGDAPIDAHTARAAVLKSVLLVDETHQHDVLAPHSDIIMDFATFCQSVLTDKFK